VEQVQWPDAVKAPFMHQAIIIRSADARSSMDVRTYLDASRAGVVSQ
jgi:hypothetical protein